MRCSFAVACDFGSELQSRWSGLKASYSYGFKNTFNDPVNVAILRQQAPFLTLYAAV